MVNNIFNQIDKLQNGLDASWIRNEVLANNIANVDTPGFKRSDVIFSNLLEQQSLKLNMTRDKHIDPLATSEPNNFKVYEDSDTSVRMDGNNVDIESEMNELAKNTILYNYISQMVSNEIKRLDMAINGGK